MGGLLGGLGDFLGTNDDFKADSYNINPSLGYWQGPQQNTLGGYLAGSQGQSAQDYGDQQAARAQQGQYLAQLQNTANGNGPSQAQAVLQQGADRAAAQSMSIARSGGGNPAQQAAAMRAGMQAGAAGMTSSGAQAAQIKSQEQQAAMAQMGGVLQGMRGQDLQSMGMGDQMSGQYLGAQMNQGQAQLGANMQMAGLQSQNYNDAQNINAGVSKENTQANSGMLGGVVGAAGALAMMSDMRAKSSIVDESGNFGKNMGGPDHGVYDLPELSGDSLAYSDGRGGDVRFPGRDAAPLPFRGSTMAVPMPAKPDARTVANARDAVAAKDGMSLAQGAGGVLNGFASHYMSDARLKDRGEDEGVNRRDSLADRFLSHLHPYSYEYKNTANEPSDQPTGGRYLGIMAQDVERAPGVGHQIVKDGPRGKTIELPAMVSGLAAGVGRLNERLAALESKRGR